MYRHLFITLISLLGILGGLQAQSASQYYELVYEARHTQHHALVMLDNQARGVIRVRFYDRILHTYQLIEQQIQVSGSRGQEQVLRLSSDCAKHVATGERSIYPANQFYAYLHPQRPVRFDRVNEQGGVSPITVRPVGGAKLQALLPVFGWKAQASTSYKKPGIQNQAGKAVKLSVNTGTANWHTMYLQHNYEKTVAEPVGNVYQVRVYTPQRGFTSYQISDRQSYYIRWNRGSGMFELYQTPIQPTEKPQPLPQMIAFAK